MLVRRRSRGSRKWKKKKLRGRGKTLMETVESNVKKLKRDVQNEQRVREKKGRE